METYFSAHFKTVRRKLGYNQTEFARILEIDISELHKIENSNFMPETETLYKLYDLGFN